MRLIKAIGIWATLSLTVSCSLDYQPLSGPSSYGFPQSEVEAVAGTYAAYQSIALNRGYNTGSWWRTLDAATDIGAYRTGGNIGPLVRGTANTENGWYKYLYQHGYQSMSAIHMTLDGLDHLRGTVADENLACMRAELLTMRSFYYDVLAQYYGGVPYVTHSLNLNNMATPRMPLAELIPNIINDLDDSVIEALPERWNKETYGTARLSKAAAYMIKARIYLNYAHEPFADGYWAKAAEYAHKAIEIAERNGHKLSVYDTRYYATHADGEPNCKLFGLEGETDDEWLWALQYNELVSNLITINIYYIATRTLNGSSYLGPSQHFVDAFQCRDGLPITESPLYDWKNPWANRDPRLDLFVVRDDSRTMGVEFTLDASKSTVTDYHSGTQITNADSSPLSNKSEYGPNGTKGPGGYLWRKGYDDCFYGTITGGDTNKTHDCINQGMLRMAELYLIEAEANIEMPGGDLELARTRINMIRERAGMPEVQATDQAGLRRALRYERMVEMCDEGLRWYDIRRWGIAETAMNRTVYAPGFSSVATPKNYISNAKPTIDENWLVTYDGTTTWDGSAFNLRTFATHIYRPGRDIHFPIPQSEIDANSAITPADQNPEY